MCSSFESASVELDGRLLSSGKNIGNMPSTKVEKSELGWCNKETAAHGFDCPLSGLWVGDLFMTTKLGNDG